MTTIIKSLRIAETERAGSTARGEQREPVVRRSVKFDTHLIFTGIS
jgi:hypothetical protein